jgi:hypothetical protein
MEPEESGPLFINQLAIEQGFPEDQRKAFRERQRQRGFRLVTDLTEEEAQQAREDCPVLAETQIEPEG